MYEIHALMVKSIVFTFNDPPYDILLVLILYTDISYSIFKQNGGKQKQNMPREKEKTIYINIYVYTKCILILK